MMGGSTSHTARNVAVVGMGYWGKNLVRNFSEIGALSLICDENPDCREMVRQEYPDISFCSDFETVLTNKKIKAVVLATPASAHYEMARKALEAGKDVLVEKPLALTVKDGERLVKLAADRQKILMVGHVLRYHPAVIKLGELIRNGDLGCIRYFYSNRLNIGKIRVEENILWSFAPHDISVMLALLMEEPCAITCQGGVYLDQNIADVTMSQFLFPSGVRGHIFVSWLHPFKEQRLVVVGSEKMAVFDDTADDKLVVYPHKVAWKNRIPTAVKAKAEKIPIAADEPLRAECLHFLECVRDRKQPLTDGREGLRVLKVLSACQVAMEREHLSNKTTKCAGNTDNSNKSFFVHETATVDEGSEIGDGTKIWHYSHVMSGVHIGRGCIIGQNCNIARGVVIGNNVKIQNNVSVYEGTTIEDDVFLGPSCVLTNVKNPRSQISRHALFEKTVLRRGATIGANATIVCGLEIGRYAFIAAGAVVTRNVPDYALVKGNPARQAGWMTRHGHPLREPDADGVMRCPESGYRYKEVKSGTLRCLDLDEEASLPEDQAVGKKTYDFFKTV